eukprot:TRINITY_DN4843_c0_g1_i1.p1 TRINITY_DN4843_c0_g1~~TRINITY_DN4843_c0_g1_i1.p1  ORF type:complete len:271 (+),score=60.37 TRINITY_DN4843_c0_g1_i1:262-1074(+)
MMRDAVLDQNLTDGFRSCLSNSVKSGFLKKLGGAPLKSVWQRRWFVLYEDRLNYFKSSNSEKLKGSIKMKDCSVRETDQFFGNSSDNFSFALVTPERTYFILARCREEYDEWRYAITAQADKASNNTRVTGYLTKLGKIRKNWKKRWFVLEGWNLKYYTSEKETKPKGIIPLEDCFIKRSFDGEAGKFCFQIRTQSRAWLLCAETKEDMLRWVKALYKQNSLSRQSTRGDKTATMFIKDFDNSAYDDEVPPPPPPPPDDDFIPPPPPPEY